MGLQRERDGGMIPQGIGRGVIQTPETIMCDHISMGKPMNPQLPFLSSVLNHQFLPKFGEAVNALGRVRHGSLMD